jgi:Flp pilus assembly protein TadG
MNTITRQLKDKRRRGISLLWTAIFILLIILLVGLTLDTARALLVAHQLQNAADAAALAGACFVKYDPNQARDQAVMIGQMNNAAMDPVLLDENTGNDPNGDVVLGRYDRPTRIFTATLDSPNAVKVVARRTDTSLGGPISLFFGPIANVDTINIERFAIAISSGGTGAGLIALREDICPGLIIQGDVTVDVNGGSIQVNSDGEGSSNCHGCGARIIGQPDVQAGDLNVQGDFCFTSGQYEPNYPIEEGAPPKPDPLCPSPPTMCLPEPSWDPNSDLTPSFDPNLTTGDPIVISGGSHVLEPGYYSGGFRITGGDVMLKPGMYILEGSDQGLKSGLVVGGNANFCAKGVMFFIAGTGVVDLAGTGDIRVTPYDSNSVADPNGFCDPTFTYSGDLGTYEQISIFQARDNYTDARIIGTSLLDLDGTLYFPSNHLSLGGTGDGFGNQLIAGTIDIFGTGDMLIMYDGRFPSVGYNSYLVE